MANESAKTLCLLSSIFGVGESDSQKLVKSRWDKVRAQMLGRTQSIVYMQDWISDFWIARGSRVRGGLLAPCWEPPEALEEWPGEGSKIADVAGGSRRRTNHIAFVQTVQSNSVSVPDYDLQAASEFLQNEDQIEQLGDARMVRGEQVRAWLATSLGSLLRGLALTPPDATVDLAKVAFDRLQMPLQFELPDTWANDFEERRLELLYSLRLNDRGELEQSAMRVGQGEQWREHWDWLSHAISAPDAIAAVQLAARLMRREELVRALLAGLSVDDDKYLPTVCLAILRRWLLTLKAMAWLEEALAYDWKFARPEDLCCFAYNAVKPEWPRRLLAISHRSADVKSTLIQMKLWKSSRAAIDANYVPSWETNTGMMWGLFAAPPAIARVHSPHYQDSIWCQREMEVTEYLAERSDFLADRWLLEVDDTSLRGLDSVTVLWEATDEGSVDPLFSSFPELCTVWSPRPMPEWQVKLYRAAAALRMMNLFLSDAALANSLADQLYTGLDMPATAKAPTNNPDGWKVYATVFRDLRPLLKNEVEKLPIHLPIPYPSEDQLADQALGQRIPDLSTGACDLRDVLVAFEWMRTEWPMMMEKNRGDFLVLNCQSFNQESWKQQTELALFRGLAAIRSPRPIWFLQSAGQEVENWPLVGQRPIFTEHVASQFAWMMEIFIEARESQATYAADSGLVLSPDLLQLGSQGPVPPDIT